jgi:hypothetical protein
VEDAVALMRTGNGANRVDRLPRQLVGAHRRPPL